MSRYFIHSLNMDSMLDNLHFESERLYTDKLTVKDAVTLFEMYSDAEAMKFRGSEPMKDLEDAHRMIREEQIKTEPQISIRLGVRKKLDNDLIGTLLLKKEGIFTSSIEFGFSFGKSHWRNGYGKETLAMVQSKLSDEEKVESIKVWCRRANIASVRIFRHAGYTEVPQSDYPESLLFIKKLKDDEKARLVILSDLWGADRSNWLIHYTGVLAAHFDIQYYDCIELAGIDTSKYVETELHKQYVNGGIERAVEKLLKIERETVHILSFSIGGTIAWKFGLQGGSIQSLIGVSSTRLRYETKLSLGRIKLYYGAEDEYKPDKKWLHDMGLEYQFIEGKGHEFYLEPAFAKTLSKEIIKDLI